ncbi:hypothetical protein COV06_03680 [Candidatus Uhrbacteria bacterium CG10_big_fil_rev_8_21_14_0_10_50_16]|uniref:Uncharacterized protein n=1 Tax=Candidatus Uhrbacteria bacterium CG10_big_fil_rev_8_21_14_0_10_50_16 TaxID=1975039 RepID=A0A2H0RNF2_9BACT|nr:MAG: hypothetical protein COV06_03680 [Candidatus Uhrbacteria bacterium CG10_big_fil_rev_8_21_14_0_10_50_16]
MGIGLMFAWQRWGQPQFMGRTAAAGRRTPSNQVEERRLDFSSGNEVEDPNEPMGLALKLGQGPHTVRGQGTRLVEHIPAFVGRVDSSAGMATSAAGLEHVVLIFTGDVERDLRNRLQGNAGRTDPAMFLFIIGLFLSEAYLYLQSSGAGVWGKVLYNANGQLDWNRFTANLLSALQHKAYGERLAWEASAHSLAPEMARAWLEMSAGVTYMIQHGVERHFLGNALQNVIEPLQVALGDQAALVSGMRAHSSGLGQGHRTSFLGTVRSAQLGRHGSNDDDAA